MPSARTKRSPRARRGALALAAILLGALTAFNALTAHAPAQSASQKLQSKLDQLNNVTARQGAIQGSIGELNARVNELIARQSAVRRQLAPVEADLARKQAELDKATNELNAQKAHLRQVRERLNRAVAALEDLLVAIYKSGDQDTTSIVLGATSWSNLIARSEYLGSIKDADDAVVNRVRQLEDQIHAIVEQLTASRQRIKAARDQIAERKAQLDKIKAAIDSQQAELSAVKAARERTLEALQARQQALTKDLSKSGLPLPGQQAKLLPNGDAVPPPNAPLQVRAVIEAANRIDDLPYVWGGGHGSFEDSGYDCSGSVSYALHGGGLLDSPLDSTGLEFWGEPGPGNWISVFANSGHVFAFIAGLRWDTGGNGGGFGPRWHTDLRDTTGFVPRHPSGL
jgi:peptidoglycan hydrolase CwlO-like protein